MYEKKKVAVSGCVVVLLLGGAACFGQGGASAASAVSASIAPGTMTRIGTIDERFQSYNIEAVGDGRQVLETVRQGRRCTTCG